MLRALCAVKYIISFSLDNRKTTRPRWKLIICITTYVLIVYSFSSLHIFVTWGWPTVAETCRQPNNRIIVFFVLLTVHLSIFISVINQLDAQNFCFTISLFHASTCFEHMCSSPRGQNCNTQPLVSSHLQVAVSCTGWERTLLSLPMHETATYRCDDTRVCVMQFWPPDDEHMCSKNVEAWNKLIVKQKFCASSWLITEIKAAVFWRTHPFLSCAYRQEVKLYRVSHSLPNPAFL